MRKRNLPKTKNSKVRRQRDLVPWKYCLLTVACGLLLVAGFFYAARSHFSSMDYAMKNAELRKQIEELESETRRLKLSKEIALSPAEIKKAAIKLGLTTMTVKNIQVVDAKAVKNSSEVSSKKSDSNGKSKTGSKTDKTGKQVAAGDSNGKSGKEEKADSDGRKREKKENAENLKKDGNFRTQIAKK